MMKIVALVFWFGLGVVLHARLADSDEQLFARYGGGKSDPGTKAMLKALPLLRGAQEYEFHYEGWRIHAALLPATDGKWYVVRERYQRLDGKMMKDYEIQAILAAEAGSQHWESESGQISGSYQKTVSSFTDHAFKSVWRREDHATAQFFTAAPLLLDLELPQAANYERQCQEILERQRQQSTPKF